MISIIIESDGRKDPQEEEKPNDDLVIDEEGRIGLKWFNWWSGRSGIVWGTKEESEEVAQEIINKGINLPH